MLMYNMYQQNLTTLSYSFNSNNQLEIKIFIKEIVNVYEDC